MTAELSPAHEARLEAFKALVAPQPIMSGEPTYFYTVGYAERATAFVADLLGELAAAQAHSAAVGTMLLGGASMQAELRERAEAAEAEVARLKATVRILTKTAACSRCWLSSSEEARHAD